MTHTPQVDKSHYAGSAYRSGERWMSYWHQLELVRTLKPNTVLEVGAGEGVVAERLRMDGVHVTTLDIAEDLHPDIVGSITAIPSADAAFDMTLAFEVLEHIPFGEVEQALRELARVSKNYVAISIPHPGWVCSTIIKIPLVRRFEIFFQVPFFWKTHEFNGEHYWELGKNGYPLKEFLARTRRAGLELVLYKKYADDPAHRFFLFKKHA